MYYMLIYCTHAKLSAIAPIVKSFVCTIIKNTSLGYSKNFRVNIEIVRVKK